MNCYACEQPAAQNCARCGKPHCLDHGGTAAAGGQPLCADCLHPASAAPSGTFFRASLFALLIGSVLALWLLIQPPDLPGEESSLVRPEPTSRSTPSGASAATPTPAVAPTESSPPPGQATAAPTETPAPTEEPEPPGPVEYTVQEGDTWYGIAEAYGVDAENLAAVNGLTLDDFLHPGDVLVIPE